MGYGLLIALASLVFAARALAAGPTATESWLERAGREIAACPAETPDGLLMAQPQDLAIAQYRLAPSGPRRVLAAQLIDRAIRGEVDKKKSAEQVRAACIAGAYDHACLGDAEGAHVWLAAAKRSNGAAPSTDPFVRFATAGMSGYLEAAIYLRLGEDVDFYKLGFGSGELEFAVKDLEADGLKDQALRAREWVQKLSAREAAAAATRPVEPDPFPILPVQQQVHAVENLVRSGKLAEAAQAAAAIDPSNEDNAYFVLDAYQAVARGDVEAGQLGAFGTIRDTMLAIAPKCPSNRDGNLDELLKLCIRAKDTTGFAAVAKVRRKLLEAGAADETNSLLDHARSLSQLAAEYATIGDQENYLATAHQATKILLATEAVSESQVKERAEDFLWLAAARACAGDAGGVAEDETASQRAGTLGPNDWDILWWRVVNGFADGGHFTEALAAAGKTRADPEKSILLKIARRQAEAGKFDEAWETLRTVPTRNRLRGLYPLVVQQVRAGRMDDLAAHIDALPTANERALGDIAAAATLQGHPFAGNLRTFDPKN